MSFIPLIVVMLSVFYNTSCYAGVLHILLSVVLMSVTHVMLDVIFVAKCCYSVCYTHTLLIAVKLIVAMLSVMLC